MGISLGVHGRDQVNCGWIGSFVIVCRSSRYQTEVATWEKQHGDAIWSRPQPWICCWVSYRCCRVEDRIYLRRSGNTDVVAILVLVFYKRVPFTFFRWPVSVQNQVLHTLCVFQAEGENVSKLEKADILELTVRHLHRLRRSHDAAEDAHRFQVCTEQSRGMKTGNVY